MSDQLKNLGTVKGQVTYIIVLKEDGTSTIQYQNSPENLLIGLSMTIDSIEHVIAKNNGKKTRGLKQTISPERMRVLRSTALWLRDQQSELLSVVYRSVKDFHTKETEKKIGIEVVQDLPDDIKNKQ